MTVSGINCSEKVIIKTEENEKYIACHVVQRWNLWNFFNLKKKLIGSIGKSVNLKYAEYAKLIQNNKDRFTSV